MCKIVEGMWEMMDVGGKVGFVGRRGVTRTRTFEAPSKPAHTEIGRPIDPVAQSGS